MDPSAWDRFIRDVQPAVAGAVRRLLSRKAGHGDSLDDLVQQTFVRLLGDDCAALRRFSGDSDLQLFAYVRMIATNLVFDYFRQNSVTLVELNPTLAEPAGPERHRLLQADIAKHLEDCVKRNPDRDRQVFWLYYQTGLSAATIASRPEFALTGKGVESLLHRLTRCLRSAIFPKLIEGKVAVRTFTEKET